MSPGAGKSSVDRLLGLPADYMTRAANDQYNCWLSLSETNTTMNWAFGLVCEVLSKTYMYLQRYCNRHILTNCSIFFTAADGAKIEIAKTGKGGDGGIVYARSCDDLRDLYSHCVRKILPRLSCRL